MRALWVGVVAVGVVLSSTAYGRTFVVSRAVDDDPEVEVDVDAGSSEDADEPDLDEVDAAVDAAAESVEAAADAAAEVTVQQARARDIALSTLERLGFGDGERHIVLAANAPVPPIAPTPPTPPSPMDSDGPRLRGHLPNPIAKVSVDEENEPVADVLREIADQANLNLVIKAARPLLRERITIRLSEVPADEALEAVLSASHGLMAEAKGSLVRVKALPGMPMENIDDLVERVVSNTGGKHAGHGVKDPELVVFGQPLEVKAGDTVKQAVVVGGPLTVRGHVTGDAVAIGGPVFVEPEAVIDGNVVSIGGQVDVKEGATVRGDKVALGGIATGLGSLIAKSSRGNMGDEVLHFFGFAAKVLRFLTLLVVAVLLVSFVPRRVERVGHFLVTRPGAAAAAGLAMLIGFVPLCLLLVVTIIGIPLIPVAIFLLAAFVLMGLTALMKLMGERLPVLQGRKTPLLEVLIGLAVVLVVDLLPWLGTFALVVASFVTAGAALLSRFGQETPSSTTTPPVTAEPSSTSLVSEP